MSAATTVQVKTRIEAIIKAYTGFGDVLTSDHNPLTRLPAVRVRAGGAAWEALSAYRWLVTRQYEIYVYVTAIHNPKDDQALAIGYEAAEALMFPLAVWLAQHTQLALGTLPGLVADVGEISDSGIGLLDYHTKNYSAFRLDLPIITAT